MHVVRPTQTTDPSGNAKEPGVARRVLIVDDNESYLETLAVALRGFGHDVRTAADPASGVEIAHAWVPDAVLLDVYLPSKSGFEIARELRRTFPPSAMMLVMVSGGDLDEETLRGAGHAGFDRCIGKLASPSAIAEMLSSEPAGAAGKHAA